MPISNKALFITKRRHTSVIPTSNKAPVLTKSTLPSDTEISLLGGGTIRVMACGLFSFHYNLHVRVYLPLISSDIISELS